MRGKILLISVIVILLVVPRASALDVNDTAFRGGLQWGLERIGAPAAWDRATGTGVTIAIVDSGIDLNHQDLKGKIKKSIACLGTGGDEDKCSGSAQDDHGHGTHVAGIAAATTNNGAGVAGTAPGADLIAVRVLEQSCDALGCSASGSSSDVSAGIRWATDNGADVINLSLGSTTSAVLGPSFASAISYAWEHGTIPVVAAGNDFVLSSGFADEPAVVVAATDRDDGAASYSNGVGSAKWAVAAPGGEGGDTSSSCGTGGKPNGVLSTYWVDNSANQYACLAGTSMAAPHVSGALAVLLSQGLSPQQAVDRLIATATDLGASGRDGTFGAGRIDLAKAAGGAATPKATTTTATPTTTAAAPTTTEAAPTTEAGSPTTATTTAGAAAESTTTTAPANGDAASGTDDTGVAIDLPDLPDADETAIGGFEVTEDVGGGAASLALEAFAGALALAMGGLAFTLNKRGLLDVG